MRVSSERCARETDRFELGKADEHEREQSLCIPLRNSRVCEDARACQGVEGALHRARRPVELVASQVVHVCSTAKKRLAAWRPDAD